MLAIVISIVAILALVLIFLPKSKADLKEVSRMIDHGEYTRAKGILQKRLHRSTVSSDARYLMARVYNAVDQNEYALMELKLILKYNKYGPIASRDTVLEMIGDIYLKEGKLDEAHRQYLLLARDHPNNFNILIHLGKILFFKNNFEDAIGSYNKARELRPNDDRAIGGLGICYFKMENMPKAKEYLEQAVQMNRKNFLAHFYFGQYYQRHQLFDSAISEYDQSMVDKSLKLESLYRMGTCYQAKEVHVRAIETFERAVMYMEDVGDKIRVQKKRTAYYAKSFNVELRYLLAQAYVVDKNFSAALEQWQEIAAVAPDYKDVKSCIQDNARYGKDRIQDFLIMKEMDFEKIARYMADYLGFIVKKLKMENKEQIIIEAQPDSLEMFQGATLLLVKRSFNPVGERDISPFYDLMQKQRIKKGLIISASGTSPTGLKFALGKPIDFVGKNQVMRLLKRFEFRA